MTHSISTHGEMYAALHQRLQRGEMPKLAINRVADCVHLSGCTKEECRDEVREVYRKHLRHFR